MTVAGNGSLVPPVRPMPAGREHVRALSTAVAAFERDAERVHDIGRRLAAVLRRGGRLLAAGNGGSAAQAQHLTAELVGRYRDDRAPMSAICLHGDTSSLTAISNDYGPDEAFARQVRAHGRPGDVLVVLSTSGRSSNVVAAVHAANDIGMGTIALTGPTPNPAASLSSDVISVDAPCTATIQEIHLAAVHLLCAAVDVELGVAPRLTTEEARA